MIQAIKKINFLSVMVITGMLLWGLSFSSSADVTYYAFVMQKTGANWVLPTSKIKQGSYRFQIVKFDSALPNKWIALRGEFEFEWEDSNDHRKGVKIKQKSTLDDYENANCTTSMGNSVWSATTNSACSWKKAGQKLVQPLIDKQKEVNRKGSDDPNFIRFFINNSVYKWKIGRKQYYIHRIHAFLKPNYFVKSKLTILSRFINPAEVETNDIATLRRWINDHQSFELARYLGTANTEHEDFYQGFSDKVVPFLNSIENKAKLDKATTWIAKANKFLDMAEGKQDFNNEVKTKQKAIEKAIDALEQAKTANIPELHFEIVNAEKRLKILDSSTFPWKWKWIFFIVVLFIIIAGVLYSMFTNDNKNDDGDGGNYDDDLDKNNRPQNRSRFSKITDSLWGSKKSDEDEIEPDNQQHNVTTNNHSDKPPYLQIDDPVSATIPSATIPPVDYVSKEDLEKKLENMRTAVIKVVDNLITEKLNQFSQQQNMDKFQNAVNTKLKQIDDSSDKLVGQGKPKATKPSLAPSENQTIEQISVESSNELRTILENNGIFEQKSWLELWHGNPAPCDLAKRLVLNYPPLKGSIIEIYYDIGVWLKKASHKIDLIIPKLNDEFDSNKHEMVKQLQQKGLANRVQEVKRLGLACDDSVLVKAQVVSS